MKKQRLLKATFVTLMVCATAGTLFACGGNKEYKVVYLGGEGATGDAPVTASYKEGAKFTVANNTFTKEGHTFTGWTDGTSTYLEGVEYTMGKADVTFTAQWEKNTTPVDDKYTVTYALGDHAATSATAPAKVSDVAKNAQVTLPAAPAAADGYEFAGWKVGTETTLKQAGDKITVTADVTVTAQWKAVDNKYVTDTEVKDRILPWWTDKSLGYYVADGEELTVQVTMKLTEVQAWFGILTDIGFNDNFYRLRPDAAVFFLDNPAGTPHNSWSEDPANYNLVIDRENWDETKYKGLYDNDGSAIQEINIAFKNKTLTVTINYYAGTDTELATPVTSVGYKVTTESDTAEIQPYFYTDHAVVSAASAKYSKASNTYVKYNFDNAKGDDADPDVYDVRVGKEYVFGAPERAGYTFNGWKSSDETDTKLYQKEDTITITGALTFTAQWTQNDYDVTYALGDNHATDATTPEAVTGKHYGDKITLPAAPAAAAGYEFKGWKVGNDATLKDAEAEIEVTDTVTITAIFEAKAQYTATFNVGDHAAEGATVADKTAYYDEEIELPAAPAAATGYEFAGWKVGDDTKEVGEKITLDANTTITAQWKAIEYTVTYDKGDHAADDATVPAEAKVAYNTKITLPAGPKAETGYAFAGWKVGDSTTLLQKDAEVLVTGVTTIVAQYTSIENSWTVTFLVNADDETGETISVNKGAQLTLPATNPTKTGYRFLGWYLSTDDTQTVLDTENLPNVTADVTYVAKWQAVYTVTVLDDLEGEAVDGAKTVYDNNGTEGTAEKLVLPTTNPEKTGYTFDGWYTVVDNEGTKAYGAQVTAETDVTADMTIAAKWTEITYTVTFKVDGKEDVELTVAYGKKLSETEGFDTIDTAKEYYRFDGWKNGETTATGDTIPTADITYTADYTQVEALPSENQNPTTETPITITATNYAPVPHWIGKIHKGEIVTLTGTMTGGPANWNTVVMCLYSGLTDWGNFRIDNFVNYADWAKNGNDQLTISNLTTGNENWQVVKYDCNSWDDFATIITNCNITISYDWTNEGYILVTAVVAKEVDGVTKSSTQIYMVAPKGATFEKDTYSIGLAADTSTTTITGKTVSTTAPQPAAAPTYSENQNPTADNKIEVGADGNVLGYTALSPVWTGKIEKGEKVVMSGTMTSAAAQSWQTAILYFYEGAAPNHNLRGDNWVNAFGELDGKFLIAPTGWDVTRVSTIDDGIVDWDVAKAIFANCDVEFTFDFTNAKQCVVSFKATGKAGEGENKVFVCTWTYVMRSGADMDDLNYSIGLGGEAVHILVDSIVRTPAENAD